MEKVATITGMRWQFIVKLCGLTLLLVIAVGMFQAKQASAYINLNPYPAPMPGDGDPAGIRAQLERCDNPNQPAPPPPGGIQNPAFAGWVSDDGDQASTVVDAAFGDPYTRLTWRANGAVCSGSQLGVSYSNFIVDSSSVAGPGSLAFIDGHVMGFPWPPRAASSTGAYRQADYDFLYMAPPGGFTTSHWITVTLNTKGINTFGASTDICISNGVGVATNTSFAACAVTSLTIDIFVNVGPPANNAPTGTVSATCTGNGIITVNAQGISDPEDGGAYVSANVSNGASFVVWNSGDFQVGQTTGTPGTTYNVSATISDSGGATAPPINTTVYCQAAPSVSCEITNDESDEVGIPYTVGIRINNNDSSQSLVNGSATVTVNGVTSTGLFGSIAHNSSANAPDNFAMSPASIPLPDVQLYPMTGEVTTVGSGGVTTTVSCPSTILRGNKSYLRAYGGDVWTGGNYGTGTCAPDPGQGGVYTWAENESTYNARHGLPGGATTSYHGAGSQLTLTTLLGVNGFTTASNRRNGVDTTYPPKGATFANTTVADEYGSPSNAGGKCIEDYWSTQNAPTTMTGNVQYSLQIAPAGVSQFTSSTGLTLVSDSGVTVNSGKQVAFYIDGDVVINQNIVYDTTTRTSYTDIPYFALIVRGNIFIDHTVNQIDGLYVAMPNAAGTGGGGIYTCTNQGAFYPLAPDASGYDLHKKCQGQLAVNGSLVAKKIKWQRTAGTLAESIFSSNPADTEAPDYGIGRGGTSHAGEVINYTPEMYMAPSPLHIISDGGSAASVGQYDSIKNLPPIF